MLTYQVVPLSGDIKNQMSVALASVVRLTEPPGYLNVPPVSATVLLAVASFVKIRMKDDVRLETPFSPETVNVTLSVNVAVKTWAVDASSVFAVPVLPRALTLSENMPVKKLAVTLNSPVPFGVTSMPTFVSSPVADSVGLLPVAAFATVTSFTAEPVAETLINSAPLVS